MLRFLNLDIFPGLTPFYTVIIERTIRVFPPVLGGQIFFLQLDKMRSLLPLFAICVSALVHEVRGIPPPAGTTSKSLSKSASSSKPLSSVSTTATTTATTTANLVPSTICQPAAPTYTPPGTTSNCCEWYIIQSGDTCANIEVDFSLTLQEFQALNTAVNDGCTNLLLGIAFVLYLDVMMMEVC